MKKVLKIQKFKREGVSKKPSRCTVYCCLRNFVLKSCIQILLFLSDKYMEFKEQFFYCIAQTALDKTHKFAL